MTRLAGILVCVATFGLPSGWSPAASAEGSDDAPRDDAVRLVYDCHRAVQAPTIDGDLSDAAWQGVNWATIRPVPADPSAPATAPPGAEAKSAALYDDVHLYFAAVVRDPSPRCDHHGRDDPVWDDDCFEIYLNPSGDGRVFYEIDVNSCGAIWDSMGLPHAGGRQQLIRAWSSTGLEAKTRPGDGGWTVEGRIRLDDLVGPDHVPPRHGDRWPANFYYLDTPAGPGPQAPLAWNRTARFDDIGRFGELRFVDYAGDAHIRRAGALARRLLESDVLRTAEPLTAQTDSLGVTSEKAGAFRALDDGTGWHVAGGFGRVARANSGDGTLSCWRVQPNGGHDPTLIDWLAPRDGWLVVLARLTEAGERGNAAGGGDGIWLSVRSADQAAMTLRLRDSRWLATSVAVKAGRSVRMIADAGPAGSHAYDFAQVAAFLVAADAMEPRLPAGWSACGDVGMTTAAPPSHPGRDDAIHVVGSDHFTGARCVLPATPGARLYRITGLVRSRLHGTTRAHVGIDYLDADGRFIRQASTRAALEDYLRWGLFNFSGSQPWTPFVSHAYDVPPEAAGLSVWCGVNAWEAPDGAGEAWFADIKVEAVAVDEAFPLGFAPLQWKADDVGEPIEDQMLLSRTPIERVQLPTMPPPVRRDDEDLPVLAWPGTAAPASFTIHALRDLAEVRVEVSDLAGEAAAVIPAGAITLHQVCYLHRKCDLMSTHEYMLVPNHLEPLRPLRVAAGRLQQVWLTVRVPKDAAPGRYRGMVRVTPAGGRTSSMSLSLEVAPIAPLTRPGLLTALYCYYLPGQTPIELREMLDDMADHGMTCTFLFNGNYRLPIEQDGRGRATIRWDQRNQLAEFFDAYRDAGFTQTLLMIVPHALLDTARVAGPRFAEVYADLWRQIRDRAGERGWATFAVVPCDEGYPYPYAEQRFELTARSIPALHAAGAAVALHALNHPTAGGFRFEREFEAVTDVILATFGHPPGCGGDYRGYRDWTGYRRAMQAQGKRVLFYNPDTTGLHPESTRFAYGVGLWMLQADGMSDWHYGEHPRGEAYVPSKVQGRTAMDFVFPPCAEHAGGPTLAWEAAREGAKDYQVLYTLDCLLREARASAAAARHALASRAEADLWEILRRVRVDTIDRAGELSLPQWTRRSVDEQKVARVHGELKIANGLKLEDYDMLRRRACHWIMELSR
jgi:hypothetical protein